MSPSSSSNAAQAAYPTPDTTPTKPAPGSRPGVATHTVSANNAVNSPSLSGSRPVPTNNPISFPLSFIGPLRFKKRRLTKEEVTRLALNKPTIRRLARRGGIRRIKDDIYAEVQRVIRARLRDILSKAIELVEHQGRKTLTTIDVVYALRLLGNPIFGFGSIVHGDEIKSRAEYMRRRREGFKRNVEEARRRREEQERDEREARVEQGLRQMRRGAR
ncbi:hypothetical protein PMZ80_008575 [Knufia obscura]|uniref:Histone H4 n=1 Tax=Knufia obscura TaxID=1635080 RepID=A0ABR0RF69_9EURO|nr:hypothetical protein PMZ80_008575 [Knufia obscura]